MTVYFSAYGRECKIEDGELLIRDPLIRGVARLLLLDNRIYGSPADPDPDFTAASIIASAMRGRVTRRTGRAPAHVPGRVY